MKAEELPSNWGACIGERSEGQNYTKLFYNDKHSLELRIHWDKGEKHTTMLHKDACEYPEASKKADSEDKAEKKALELMKKYNEGLNR